MQELVGKVSAFAALPPDALDAELSGALRELGTCLDLDLCLLWQPAFGIPGVYGGTHAWRSDAVAPLPAPLWMHDALPWCASEARAGKARVLPSRDALPEGAGRDREFLGKLDLESAFLLPLGVGGGPLEGVLTLHSRLAERPWPAGEVRELEAIGLAMAHALARRRADPALALATGMAAEMTRAVAARVESETRLAAAINVAGVGFYELQSGYEVRYFDDRLRALLGLSRAQVARASTPLHSASRRVMVGPPQRVAPSA